MQLDVEDKAVGPALYSCIIKNICCTSPRDVYLIINLVVSFVHLIIPDLIIDAIYLCLLEALFDPQFQLQYMYYN